MSRKPWEAGDTVDGYRLERRLARGGMADLFLATPPAGGDPVVVKAIRDDCVGRNEMLRLFEREAALLPMLDHPSIVHVDTVRIDVWNSYIAMEFLDGCDLRDLVRISQAAGRQIPLGICLRIVLDVLDGLQFAHELTAPNGTPLGVVHRDVSPSNVMVTLDGRVKLLDFGIAKMQLNTPTSSRIGTKGKGCYMAPEQCEGLRVDPRTDVYAVGTVLYELSTSRRAFSGSNEMAVLHSILKGKYASPTELNPGYPPALESVLAVALHRQGDERYQSAAEMSEAVREAATVSGIEVADRKALQAFIGEFSNLSVGRDMAESLSSLRSHPGASLGAHVDVASTPGLQADTVVVGAAAPVASGLQLLRWLAVPVVAALALFAVLRWDGDEPSTAGRIPLPSLVPSAAASPSVPPEPAVSEARSGSAVQPGPSAESLSAGVEVQVQPTKAPRHATKHPAAIPKVRSDEPGVLTTPQPTQPGTGLRIDDELRPPKL